MPRSKKLKNVPDANVVKTEIKLPDSVNKVIINSIKETNALKAREEELTKVLGEIRTQALHHSNLVGGLLRGELLREGYDDMENWSYSQETGTLIKER